MDCTAVDLQPWSDCSIQLTILFHNNHIGPWNMGTTVSGVTFSLHRSLLNLTMSLVAEVV